MMRSPGPSAANLPRADRSPAPETASMRVEFLGTGGYHPNERRHTTCVMLPETGIVLDAGTAFFRVAARLETSELHIFLSHPHLDHVVGLTYLLPGLELPNLKHAHVYASAATLAAIREHLFAEALFPILPGYDFHPLSGPVNVPGGGLLRHQALVHPGGSTGFRIDWPDRSLAFITDTTVDGSYTEFVRGVDLLIHECYFGDDLADRARLTGHSFTTPVAALARDAQVKRLVLTHVDPRALADDPIGLDRARAIFPATDLASDLMTIDISPR
jgi:ribonuclease BN (tRNA processing enzyme)